MEEIEDINKEITELRSKLSELYAMKEELQLKGKDYTGKFIKDSDRGYMYVTRQFNNDCENNVVLQGIVIESSKSTEYSDCAYISFSALDEWYIPINTFLNGNDIVEVSKSEFINEFKLAFSDSIEFGMNWINKIIEDD